MCESDFKKANDLFRDGDFFRAKEIYNSLLNSENTDFFIRGFIESNLKLLDRMINPYKKETTRECALDIESEVFVGIASIPQRKDVLEFTINSLVDQVDKIGVFLDGYDEVPDCVKNNKKIVYLRSQDFDRKIGDAGKFYWVDEFEGFYFTCDDDLVYPKDYISRIKKKIVSYGKPIVIGWHGSVIKEPFKNYYSSESRRVFSFGAPRPYDTPVHILGTGCMGFHTNHMAVSFRDFPTPNMADVYFARLGQWQNVPFLVIKHDRSEITESENTRDTSIYSHSSGDKEGSHHNTKHIQNEIVSQVNWRLNYHDSSLNILIIGRFNINPKGGVFKSSHLLSSSLKSIGHNVTECCLSEISNKDFSESNYDFSIVYAPDPERPDFSVCLDKVKELNGMGTVCAVNFSFNLNRDRTEWIKSKLIELNEGFKNPKSFFASFSNATAIHLGEEFQNLVIPFPKTISISDSEDRGFDEREGIFLGDLAKLTNSALTHGGVLKWIEQLRVQLPNVNIYALKHYHTNETLTNYVKVLPYTNNIENLLNKFRICVNLTPCATFEMVPVESMLLGTPVVHRYMPQSLSEYLSPISIEVNSPEELGGICSRIYNNPRLWSKASRAGKSLKNYIGIDNAIFALDMAIRKAIIRSGGGYGNR